MLKFQIGILKFEIGILEFRDFVILMIFPRSIPKVLFCACWFFSFLVFILQIYNGTCLFTKFFFQ